MSIPTFSIIVFSDWTITRGENVLTLLCFVCLCNLLFVLLQSCIVSSCGLSTDVGQSVLPLNNAHTHTHTHTREHTRTRAREHTCARTHTHTREHTRTRAREHTHTHQTSNVPSINQ